MNKPLYTKGTRIRCWKCEKNILLITRDIFSGEFVDADMFREINGHPKIYNGDFLQCKLCGTSLEDPNNNMRFFIDDSTRWGFDELEVAV